MSHGDHESELLFQRARAGMEPARGARERVRAKLAISLGAGVVAAVASAGTSASAATGIPSGLTGASGTSAGATTAAAGAAVGVGSKAVASALLFKVGAAGIVLASVVGAATLSAPRLRAMVAAGPSSPASSFAAHGPAPHPPVPFLPAVPTAAIPTAASMAAASPTDVVPVITADGLPDAPKPSSHAPRSPAHGSTPPPPALAAASASTSTAPLESAPDAEAALVGQMDGALRAGDGARAMRLAAEHETRFPRGLLVEEREGTRVIARCLAGSLSGAAPFLDAHPRSPMRARIVASCRGRNQP